MSGEPRRELNTTLEIRGLYRADARAGGHELVGLLRVSRGGMPWWGRCTAVWFSDMTLFKITLLTYCKIAGLGLSSGLWYVSPNHGWSSCSTNHSRRKMPRRGVPPARLLSCMSRPVQLLLLLDVVILPPPKHFPLLLNTSGQQLHARSWVGFSQ